MCRAQRPAWRPAPATEGRGWHSPLHCLESKRYVGSPLGRGKLKTQSGQRGKWKGPKAMGSITSTKNNHPEKCKGLGGGYRIKYRHSLCPQPCSRDGRRGCKEVLLSPSRIAAQWTKKLPIFSSLGFRGKKRHLFSVV